MNSFRGIRQHAWGVVVIASLVISAAGSVPAGEPDRPGEFMFSELSWLAGRWQGEAFGGAVEETWDRPWGGSMIGTFKLVADGEVGFYEFMTITADSSGAELRIKHFNGDLTGWEEKEEAVTFRFVSMGERQVQFEGVSYRLGAPDSLRITINLGHSEGETREMVIDCVRVQE